MPAPDSWARMPVHALHASLASVMAKCGLVFQEERTHKGALVVWYAIERTDWQAGQAAARP
jgi:hypothetical protein